MLNLVEERYCPVCGEARMWNFGLVRHMLDGAKYVHVRLNVMGEKGLKQMASILKDGKRYLAPELAE